MWGSSWLIRIEKSTFISYFCAICSVSMTLKASILIESVDFQNMAWCPLKGCKSSRLLSHVFSSDRALAFGRAWLQRFPMNFPMNFLWYVGTSCLLDQLPRVLKKTSPCSNAYHMKRFSISTNWKYHWLLLGPFFQQKSTYLVHSFCIEYLYYESDGWQMTIVKYMGRNTSGGVMSMFHVNFIYQHFEIFPRDILCQLPLQSPTLLIFSLAGSNCWLLAGGYHTHSSPPTSAKKIPCLSKIYKMKKLNQQYSYIPLDKNQANTNKVWNLQHASSIFTSLCIVPVIVPYSYKWPKFKSRLMRKGLGRCSSSSAEKEMGHHAIVLPKSMGNRFTSKQYD